ncbi:hypothetical protein E4U55_003682 [Claviceps digitariae]|nr:hypothetical protein E4U55_003682 [Claviceps digitariae]
MELTPIPDNIYRQDKDVKRFLSRQPAVHIACHAFEADRNGHTMLANQMSYGMNMGMAATLSYSFYVHTNLEDAVMEGGGWWLQEINKL